MGLLEPLSGWATAHPVWVAVLVVLVTLAVWPWLAFVVRKLGAVARPPSVLRLRNHTTKAVFVRLYLADGLRSAPHRAASPIVRLDAGATGTLALHAVAWTHEQLLAWSVDRVTLEPRPGRRSHYKWRSLGVGLAVHGMLDFVLVHPSLTREPGAVALMTPLEEAVLARFDHVVRDSAVRLVRDVSAPGDGERPLASEAAARPATCFSEPGSEELAWLAKRAPHVRVALGQLLDAPDAAPHVNVTILMSGGGARATVGAAGLAAGLEQQGLLAAATRVVCTSGASWWLAQWAQQLRMAPVSVAECAERTRVAVRTASAKPMFPPLTELAGPLKEHLALKLAYNQAIGLVDVYGCILGTRFQVPPTLSSQMESALLAEARVPLPVYHVATLDVLNRCVISEGFTPLACSFKGVAIPAHALGRPWDAGECLDNQVPELRMSVLLGAFGSAFCSTVEKIAENFFWVGRETTSMARDFLLANAVVLVDSAWEALRRGVNVLAVDNRRNAVAIPLVYPTTVPSWAFDSNAQRYTPSSISLVDGGIDVNLAWPLAERYGSQVVLAFDFADDTTSEGYLTIDRLKRLYAQQQEPGAELPSDGLRWPPIPESIPDIHAASCNVWGDARLGERVVVYVALTKPFREGAFDPRSAMGLTGHLNTANFVYSSAQFDEYFDFVCDAVRFHRGTMVEALRQVVAASATKK